MQALTDGRYGGAMSNTIEMELRISRHTNGKLDCASGDVRRGSVHLFSFLLEGSAIEDFDDGGFKGNFSPIGSVQSLGRICVVPERDDPTAAEVTLTAGARLHGILRYVGPAFRKLRLDVDAQIGLPGLDPDLYSGEIGRPALRTALADTGIEAEIELHPPAAAHVETISLAELHVHLNRHWSRADPDASMRLHMLLCDRPGPGVDPGALGVMYDTPNQSATPESNASVAQRRGIALFLGHTSLEKLGAGSREWRRELVFAMVHELGHALNLPHSWERSAVEERDHTWMTYPHRHAAGSTGFWKVFETHERFHPVERRFLHHAPFADIAPGQNPYGKRVSELLSGGGSTELLTGEPSAGAVLSIAPLKRRYVLGEPVFLSVEVRNEGPRSLSVARALDPSEGYLKLSIRPPCGEAMEFHSPAMLCGVPRTRRLQPGKAIRFDGVLLSHSIDGPPFDRPGRYEIEAEFGGITGRPIAAATSLRILYPTREEELFALDLWEDDALARTIWLRHPLVDRERWNVLMEEKAERVPKDPSNSTGSYLHYIAALGWMQPHCAADGRLYEPSRAKSRDHLKLVDPTGLPSGVMRRMRSLRVKHA